MTLELTNGSKFTIEGIKGSSIIVRNEQNEKTPLVSVSVDDIIELLTNDVQLHNVRDIKNISTEDMARNRTLMHLLLPMKSESLINPSSQKLSIR